MLRNTDNVTDIRRSTSFFLFSETQECVILCWDICIVVFWWVGNGLLNNEKSLQESGHHRWRTCITTSFTGQKNAISTLLNLVIRSPTVNYTTPQHIIQRKAQKMVIAPGFWLVLCPYPTHSSHRRSWNWQYLRTDFRTASRCQVHP